MEITKTKIEGLLIITPNVFKDSRGSFFESWNSDQFKQIGITDVFDQDNQSISSKNVLRGLHFQNPPYAQSKLVRVVRGSVLDVAVDLRKNSPTFGMHHSVTLSEKNNKLFYIPKGFAHGFLSLEDNTVFCYKCSGKYNKSSEESLMWNDMDLKIPVPSVSDKPDAETNKTILSQIISARVDEIFKAIQKEISDSGYSSLIRAGIVLTGGGAKLEGLDSYAESYFNTPSRIGSPMAIKGLEDLRGKTRYSTAVGLLLYRESELKSITATSRYSSKITNLFSKFSKTLSNYFHKEL